LKSAAVIFLCAAAGSIAVAQTPVSFASGLENPAKAIIGPNGSVIVSESGTNTPNTGRISIISSAGARSTLIDGLPSGLSAPNNEVDGPTGVAISGRTLYIGIGEGDTHISGPKQGTLLPNPVGSSSPLFAAILKATFSNDLDKIASGFTLKVQDHVTLLDGAPVTFTNATGDTVSIQLLTAFRIDVPDPNLIVRNSHPYAITMLASQPNTLYGIDAGMNSAFQIDTTSGRMQTITHFAATPDPLAPQGPPFIEAVPTSIQPYNNQLLVTLLSGAPFVAGQSRVQVLDASGKAYPFMGLLSSAIDVLYRQKADGSNQWLVLEYSLNLGAGAPGRLLVYDTWQGQTLADNLTSPSAMAYDASSGNLYITDKEDGTLLKLTLTK